MNVPKRGAKFQCPLNNDWFSEMMYLYLKILQPYKGMNFICVLQNGLTENCRVKDRAVYDLVGLYELLRIA